MRLSRWTGAILAGMLLMGCPRGEEQEPAASPAASPEAVASPGAAVTQADAGRQVFDQQCANCHGTGGTGNGPAASALKPPPRDLTKPAGYKFGATKADVVKTIKNGSPGTAMPPFAASLSEEQIGQVADYVVSLQK